MTERIFYVDEQIQERIDITFELIETKGWYLLYQSKVDKTYWRLDHYDKLQQQYLVKLDSLERWEEFDDKELRIELLKRTRGFGTEKCMWNQCERSRLHDLVFCERHAYEEMGIRR
jgi:hypothetical protein